jgi:hypothetical protein
MPLSHQAAVAITGYSLEFHHRNQWFYHLTGARGLPRRHSASVQVGLLSLRRHKLRFRGDQAVGGQQTGQYAGLIDDRGMQQGLRLMPAQRVGGCPQRAWVGRHYGWPVE